ncbi:MAG: M20 family metallopeptidase [Proteobacteria bacterium]|nr:M20 family metallopeptidase [Pseudomonadota bacterium]
MFDLLEKMVLINSGTGNKEGVDRVARLITSALISNSVSCQSIQQDKLGNHLVVRSHCREQFDRQILILGHMDTVFPKDTDFNWYKDDGANCYGPGVIDMKGGLVCGIFALKALDAHGLLHNIPLTFIFNSDEEIGSPGSAKLIENEARNSACAFVLECGGPEGQIVTGRKGNLSLKLTVFGKAGHAAFADKDKGSAVLELAYKIIDLESLNDFEKKITVNVGKISGGIGPNTVPEHAGARIDCRFVRPKDQNDLKENIFKIIGRQYTPHTRAHLEIVSSRPPMQQTGANRKLFQSVQAVADRLGFPVKAEFRSGVSDANIIAEQKIPVIDGLGPIGANDHSRNEYLVKASLVQRSALLACAITACCQSFLGHDPKD